MAHKEEDDAFFKQVYGEGYRPPPRAEREKEEEERRKRDRERETWRRDRGRDREREMVRPRDILGGEEVPTDFRSKYSNAWDARARAAERMHNQRLEDDLTCRNCGEHGHPTQGCPNSLGANRRATQVAPFVMVVNDRQIRPRLIGTKGAIVQGLEKESGCRIRLEDNTTPGAPEGSFVVRVIGADKDVVEKGEKLVRDQVLRLEEELRANPKRPRLNPTPNMGLTPIPGGYSHASLPFVHGQGDPGHMMGSLEHHHYHEHQQQQHPAFFILQPDGSLAPGNGELPPLYPEASQHVHSHWAAPESSYQSQWAGGEAGGQSSWAGPDSGFYYTGAMAPAPAGPAVAVAVAESAAPGPDSAAADTEEKGMEDMDVGDEEGKIVRRTGERAGVGLGATGDADAGGLEKVPATMEELDELAKQETADLAKSNKIAEDKERVRHQEKMDEIAAEYEKKIVELKGRQAERRNAFFQLQKLLGKSSSAGVSAAPKSLQAQVPVQVQQVMMMPSHHISPTPVQPIGTRPMYGAEAQGSQWPYGSQDGTPSTGYTGHQGVGSDYNYNGGRLPY